MSDTSGSVRALDGSYVGETTSLESEFVENAERAAKPVYAVLGPDSSAEFRARVLAVCPVIVDESASGVALLLSGLPSEWTPLSRG